MKRCVSTIIAFLVHILHSTEANSLEVSYEGGPAPASAAFAADPAAAAAGAAAQEAYRLPDRVVARFTLGDNQHYELPIHLGPKEDGEGAQKKGHLRGSATGFAAGILCMVLLTVFRDIVAAARHQQERKHQRREAKALETQRMVALAAMRQAAELLLQHEKQMHQQHEKQLQQQQRQQMLAAAAGLEENLILLQDDFPNTTAAGGELVIQLLHAAGALSSEQVQQRQQRLKQQRMEQQQQEKEQQEKKDKRPPSVRGLHSLNTKSIESITSTSRSRGPYFSTMNSSSSNSSSRSNSSSSSNSSKTPFAAFLEQRDQTTGQWDPLNTVDTQDDSWGTLLDKPADPLEDLVAMGGPMGAPQFPHLEDLAGLLSENRNLNSKDAFAILRAIGRYPKDSTSEGPQEGAPKGP
ncbi:hypothetical protein, conserved [Eimeria maxima]|uniref:Uncharacterized protein n=1 Tax=Eimeria maxima TaxID=5804 RepID=U6MFP0_EIMMA|nr:hypothetical protein, conserved [Eimeria maxima]CDJ61873.1 hypothetical protein, conserved [Eimeria maxima]